MSLKEVSIVRFKAKCANCGVNLRKYKESNPDKKVYSKHRNRSSLKHYCEDCKKELFGGVKLRDGYKPFKKRRRKTG